ncbi:MAG TPA: hypothetical protein VNN79_00780, partial [Actinomycetota bacterium]|nr:hypothetical protein [Actinomycetota bacterium]
MKLRSRATFRRRVAVGSGVAVAVAVAAVSGIVYLIVRGELRSQVDEALRERLHQVTQPNNVIPVVNTDTGKLSVLIPPPNVEGESPGYVQFVATDGTVVRPRSETGPYLEPNQTSLGIAKKGGLVFSDAEFDGEHYRVVTEQMPGFLEGIERMSNPIPQPLAVQVARPLGEVDAALKRLAFLLVGISTAGIALGVLLGFLITRTAARPV